MVVSNDSGSPRDNGIFGPLNRGFGFIAGWCFDHRWVVIAVCAVTLVGLIEIARFVELDVSMGSFFHEGDPTYGAYLEYREDFGSDEVAYIGYEVPNLEYGPWNVEAMETLISLTEAFEDEVPFVYEATSLANVEFTLGNEDGIEISKIVDDWPLSQQELLKRRDLYHDKPMILGNLVDEDADFAAIIIKMDRSSNDTPEELLAPPEEMAFPDDPTNIENSYPQVSDRKIVEILDRPKYSAYEFFVSGDVSMTSYMSRIMFTEPPFLLAITVAIVSAILLVMFRSTIAMISPLLVIAMSLAGTVALMALCGFKVGLDFSSTPTLLAAIGVAHSVHILSEFRARLRSTRDRRESLVHTMSLVGAPCLLTSLTTAIGFASMGFVPIRALAESAVSKGFGVLLAFFFSTTLLLALLSLDWTWMRRRILRTRSIETPEADRAAPSGARAAPSGARAAPSGAHNDLEAKDGAWIGVVLDWTARVNVEHRNALLGLFVAVLVVLGIGASRVVPDSSYLGEFWETSQIHVDTIKVDSEMGGTTNAIYLFDTGVDDAIKNPEVLREIDRLQSMANEETWLVTKTHSIVDIVKDLNQTFHGDDAAYHVIPDSREEVAQYLLLYESSGGEEAEEYVSSDYRRANLELRLRMERTSAMKRLLEGLDARLVEEPLVHSTVTLTGMGSLFLRIMDFIVSSQIEGFTIAFSVITLVMISIFRSLKVGLISMVPNLAPVFVALGVMGWFDITLDYNKVMIAGIVLGISVDDTVHLMTRFHHEFQVHRNYEKALKLALADVGRALIITSLALVLGFVGLMFSELRSQAFYGILLAASLVAALIADFLFMPALVLKFKPFGPEGEGRAKNSGLELREAA